MITTGIDLSADPKKTGVAQIEWRETDAALVEVAVGFTKDRAPLHDDQIVQIIARSDRTGIDCPFGWPIPFVEFVAAHQNGAVSVDPVERERLRYRRTDVATYQATGITCLSVSSDRLGSTAMRCARILAMLSQKGAPVDRSGVGSVVEVYPAAALHRWRLRRGGYKGAANADARRGLVDDIVDLTGPWLDWRDFASPCITSDDALDAVLCAIVARFAALGRTDPLPREHRDVAQREGWIAIPSEGCVLDAYPT